MAGLLGNVVIGFQIDTERFKLGTKEYKAELKRLEADFEESKSAVLSFGAALATGLFAGAVSFAAMLKNTLSTIDAQADLAASLGTSVEALGALQYATQLTGSEAEALNGTLQKMQINLAGVVGDAGPVALALRQVGLSAKELKNLDPTLAFKRIAVAIQQIEDPMSQADVAMTLLGKTGVQLLGTLRNAGDLEKLEQEFRDLGGSISTADAQLAGEFMDNLDKLGVVWQGVQQKLAVEFAPAMIGLAEIFLDIAKNGIDGGSQIGQIYENVTGIITGTAAVFHVFGVAIKSVQLLLTGLGGLILGFFGGLQALSERVMSPFSSLLGIPKIGNTILAWSQGFFEKFGEQAEHLFDGPMGITGSSVGGFFDEIRKKGQQASDAMKDVKKTNDEAGKSAFGLATRVADLTEKYADEIRLIGKSAQLKEIDKIAQDGATEAMLAGVRAQAKRIEELEKVQELAKGLKDSTMTHAEKQAKQQERLYEAFNLGLIDQKVFERASSGIENFGDKVKTVMEDAKNPLEKYKKSFSELEKMRDLGAITEDQFTLAGAKLSKETFGDMSNYRPNQALEAGSQEARSAILSYNFSNTGKDPIEIAKQQLEQAKRSTAILEKLYNKPLPATEGIDFGRGNA